MNNGMRTTRPEGDGSPFSPQDRPITPRLAAGAKQDHETIRDAYFRLRDERTEFKSEGWCGPLCPCQVPCNV